MFYADTDADGYGDPADMVESCEAPSGYVADNTDCDDGEGASFPGNAEVCDGLDNNCDTQVDEGVLSMFYADTDADGYGDPESMVESCDAPSGYVTDNTDCDDGEGASFPGNAEVCDGLDNNCDTQVDEGVLGMFYADADADGYGDPAAMVESCTMPSGYVTDDTDCDDTEGRSFPGNPELCDGVDNDCDPATSEDGTASFTDTAGTTTDFTASMTGSVLLSDAGTYTVCDGTWAVQLDIEADVVLQSANGAATTILTGEDTGTVVDVLDGYTVEVDGFTLTAGFAEATSSSYGYMGGAVYCDGASNLTVRNSTITDSTAIGSGGGIGTPGCDLTILDTDFDGNTAPFGGDIIAFGAPAVELDGLRSTTATASSSGGSVYLGANGVNVVAQISNSVIDGASSGGGAMFLDGSSGEVSVTMSDSSIINSPEFGVYLYSPGTIALDAFAVDMGSSDSGNDNATDVYVGSIAESNVYDDVSWFSCTLAGCDDYAVYAGATGRFQFRYQDWSTTPAAGSYDCMQDWDIVATGTDSMCDACDFAFEATWTVDTTTLVETDCLTSATDSSFGIGFAENPSYFAYPMVYLENYGRWYPVWSATRTGSTISVSTGVDDYLYDYYGTYYYYTSFESLELTAY